MEASAAPLRSEERQSRPVRGPADSPPPRRLHRSLQQLLSGKHPFFFLSQCASTRESADCLLQEVPLLHWVWSVRLGRGEEVVRTARSRERRGGKCRGGETFLFFFEPGGWRILGPGIQQESPSVRYASSFQIDDTYYYLPPSDAPSSSSSRDSTAK